MELEQLRRMVREAFPLVVPGQFAIVVHNCPECAEVDDAFRGRRWDQIQPDVIEWWFDALPLLSREAFEYLLPAYMLHALDYPDTNVPEFLMYSLDKPRWPRETW
ncbi:MAG TPA: hypothetical protein VLM40_13875, partial [Gemmata sp.]|nr:hypothetical protein [Gemmata sp.]